MVQNVSSAVVTASSRRDTDRPVNEYKITLWDKPSMFKLAGRHLGLFSDRAQSIGGDNQEIERMSDPESKQLLLELARGPAPTAPESDNGTFRSHRQTPPRRGRGRPAQ